jgi:hypothetical protein
VRPSSPIRLRYPAVCGSCATELPRRTQAIWDRTARTATCLDCAGREAPPEDPRPLERGEAGSSARRRYERLRARHETRVRERWGRLSSLYLALTDEPQSTRSWGIGSSGERELGASLDAFNDDASLIVLHDRRIPGSRANIDHLVISAAGIFVVDAKHYSGKVRKVDRGGWLSTDFRLYVGERDRTKLIPRLTKQVEAVREALGEPLMQEFALAITPVLCFVYANWRLFARPFQLGGVWVERPESLAKRVRKPGPLASEHVVALSKKVVAALPRA